MQSSKACKRSTRSSGTQRGITTRRHGSLAIFSPSWNHFPPFCDPPVAHSGARFTMRRVSSAMRCWVAPSLMTWWLTSGICTSPSQRMTLMTSWCGGRLSMSWEPLRLFKSPLPHDQRTLDGTDNANPHCIAQTPSLFPDSPMSILLEPFVALVTNAFHLKQSMRLSFLPLSTLEWGGHRQPPTFPPNLLLMPLSE